MQEQDIKSEMRLFMIESLVALLWASQHKVAPDPAASVEYLRTALIEKARRQSFAGLDPAESDLLSAELEAAADRAVSMQAAWMGLRKG